MAWCDWILNLLESNLPVAGRETFLVKVDWDDDWPIFNNGRNIEILTEGRHGHQISSPAVWKAALDQDSLELGWYHKREFCHISYRTKIHLVEDQFRYACEKRMVVVCETWPSPPPWWLLQPLRPRVSDNAPP